MKSRRMARLGQGHPIADEDRVDGIVSGLIPQLRVPLSAPAVVRQGTVRHLMGEDTLQFSGSELLDKGRVVDEPASIRDHGGETRHGEPASDVGRVSRRRADPTAVECGPWRAFLRSSVVWS